MSLLGDIFDLDTRHSAILAPVAPERKQSEGRLSAQIKLTHEQLGTLAGTSREITTKILGELAEDSLLTLGRGRITLLLDKSCCAAAAATDCGARVSCSSGFFDLRQED